MGWYHSHPFDVDEDHDNCFFSSTDLSTQLSWQNAEDPQGNPFLAIVLDPLRSAAKNSAALAASARTCRPTRHPRTSAQTARSAPTMRAASRSGARAGTATTSSTWSTHVQPSSGHRRRAQPEPPLGEDAE